MDKPELPESPELNQPELNQDLTPGIDPGIDIDKFFAANPSPINHQEPTEPTKFTGPTYCGTIGIIGRPNVGKSTLLNKILGRKISITCRKPQTTRHHILGIKTKDNVQAIYVDTPGLHQESANSGKAINKYMNRTARSIMFDVDILIFLIDSDKWTTEEDLILSQLAQLTCPVILAINKADLIKNKPELLPLIKNLSEKFKFTDIIPISAKHNQHLDHLEKIIQKLLPEQAFIYPEDQLTDKSQKFLAAEVIREKLMRTLGDEIPYDLTVEIEHFKTRETHPEANLKPNLIDIAAIIYVERETQKPILIGAHGGKLKEIGTQARIDLENLFGKKIFLRLWVKVKSGWSDDEKSLQSLGYD